MLGWGPILTTGVKYWLNVKFLRIFFCLQTVLRQQSVKQICAPPIWTGLSDFNICYSDAVRVLSSVLFITQSDTRNIEYLISWLQKLCLEYLLFGWGTSLLNCWIATNFLNFRELRSPYFSKGFLRNLRPCFDTAFVKLRVIPRTKNRFVEILAVWECYLITNHVKNLKKQPFRIWLPVKLTDGRISVKKEKNYSHFRAR